MKLMKKIDRNLLYPIPIAELDETKLLNRASKIIGHNVEKFNLATAAEYKGIAEAYFDCRKLKQLNIDGEETSPVSTYVYCTKIPEVLSFAFRHDHGIQRFHITEIGKRNKPNTKYEFSVTDFEFYEDQIIFFGIAKNSETHEEKEYLTYLFIDQYIFYNSDIAIRKLRNMVYFDHSEITAKRLSKIIKYAYKYLKYADEVRLSKLTELLTGEHVKKPGKQMFEVLNKALRNSDQTEDCHEVIEQTLGTAFHRFVQTSRERKKGLYVQDKEGVFELQMEEIRPCADKKGLRCRGLRSFDERPSDSYRINIEYDFKKNSLTVYDENWEKITGSLTCEENANNMEEIKNIRRCINTFFNAKK